MQMNLLLVLLWLFRTNMTCIQAICLSPGPENSEVVRFVPLAAFAPNRPRRSPRPPLLFGVHLDASFRTLPFSKVLETRIVQPAMEFWQMTLSLVSYDLVNVKLDRQCVGGNVGFVQEEDSSKNRPISFCIQGCEPITRCGPVHVPPEHLHSCRNASNPHLMPSDMPQTGGPNFRIYVSALSSAQCDKSEASIGFAAHCQQESQTDRPIAGFINFCPRELLRKHAQTAELTYFVKHEMLHILGFSSSLYAFFRGPTGEPLTPRQLFPPNPNLGWFDQSRGVYKWSEGVIKLVVRNWTSSCGVFPKVAHLLRTPTVLRVAREYFDCPSLEGVELEDHHLPGVSLSHWETRLLGNDLMTPTYTNAFALSKLTLALMEDTGWYLANYSSADDLPWGFGRGCLFATGSCFQFMSEQTKQRQSTAPFCYDSQLTRPASPVHVSCLPGGSSFGYCNLVRHRETLPPEYTYFASPNPFKTSFSLASASGLLSAPGEGGDCNLGGKVEMANFCPFVQEITWELQQGSVSRSSICTEPLNTFSSVAENYNLEIYGRHARCFSTSLNWRLTENETVFHPPVIGAACFEFCLRV
uniref:Leishmanolysin-like peptidase n=2 Tax=Schistocephalus solidus TaxID=70667 RepID=A0A0X3NMF4_SCHSO